jgi:hypothetical protein
MSLLPMREVTDPVDEFRASQWLTGKGWRLLNSDSASPSDVGRSPSPSTNR